ncbi:MAG: hypothetical protein M1831_005509 [Alyxoria varia]|nr:MAG: hypothetical protein M1831_005509 [Alyxoria varia]
MVEIKEYEVREPYLRVNCTLGEGPHWDEDSNALYFLDIPKGEVHTIQPAEGPSSHKVTANLDTPVSVLANVQDHQEILLAGAKDTIGVLHKDTGTFKSIKELYEKDEKQSNRLRGHRLNDGACDPQASLLTSSDPTPISLVFFCPRRPASLTQSTIFKGRFFVGSMCDPSLEDSSESDSNGASVYAFDYDASTGRMTNKRVFFSTDGDELPDGHVIDVEDHLWIAMFKGSKVLRVSPQGEVVAKITLPTRAVTCPVFVGEELYITTGMDPEGSESSNFQGDLFKCHVGVSGRPKNRFKLKASVLT